MGSKFSYSSCNRFSSNMAIVFAVLSGADVSLGVVASSLGRSHRFGDVF